MPEPIIERIEEGGDAIVFTTTVSGKYVGKIFPFTNRKLDLTVQPHGDGIASLTVPVSHVLTPGAADGYHKLWRSFREFLLEKGVTILNVIYHCPSEHFENLDHLKFWWNNLVFKYEIVTPVFLESGGQDWGAEIDLRRIRR